MFGKDTLNIPHPTRTQRSRPERIWNQGEPRECPPQLQNKKKQKKIKKNQSGSYTGFRKARRKKKIEKYHNVT